MGKLLVLCILLGVIASSSLWAQPRPDEFGAQWRSMSASEKAVFVAGVESGIKSDLEVQSQQSSPSLAVTPLEQMYVVFGAASNERIVGLLDEFWSKPRADYSIDNGLRTVYEELSASRK